jgi:hypothetical protein
MQNPTKGVKMQNPTKGVKMPFWHP